MVLFFVIFKVFLRKSKIDINYTDGSKSVSRHVYGKIYEPEAYQRGNVPIAQRQYRNVYELGLSVTFRAFKRYRRHWRTKVERYRPLRFGHIIIAKKN